jgi:hypothetical protein
MRYDFPRMSPLNPTPFNRQVSVFSDRAPKFLKAVLLALVVSVFGCGGSNSTNEDSPSATPYEIIGRDQAGNMKCSFDVRLEDRIPEAEIRSVAEEIKSREAEDCERTFIVYYLPGMEVDAGGWATSHFNPGLEVRVLGLTAEQSASSPVLPEGDLVGRWLGKLPPGWFTIVRRGGKVIGRWDFGDGSNSEEGLTESKVPDGRPRFEDEGGNPHGEYYVLETDGRLGMYGESGRFELMERDAP